MISSSPSTKVNLLPLTTQTRQVSPVRFNGTCYKCTSDLLDPLWPKVLSNLWHRMADGTWKWQRSTINGKPTRLIRQKLTCPILCRQQNGYLTFMDNLPIVMSATNAQNDLVLTPETLTYYLAIVKHLDTYRNPMTCRSTSPLCRNIHQPNSHPTS